MLFRSLVTCAIVVIICYYLHLRVNDVNLNIECLWTHRPVHRPGHVLSRRQIYRALESYLSEHDYLCKQVTIFNNYWQHVYLLFLMTIVPLSLIILHQLLFANYNSFQNAFILMSLLCAYTILFGVQYFLAQFSVKIHKMYRKLSRIQWSLNGLRFKLKLLNRFERLSGRKKIGISIGSLIIITFPVLSKVCITYSNVSYNQFSIQYTIFSNFIYSITLTLFTII